MEDKNRKLLEEVIQERLTRVQIAEPGNEDDKQAFKEAMEALNKKIELDKLEASHDEQVEKLKIENERLMTEREKNLRDEAAKKEEAKKDRLVQIGLFLAGLTLGELVDYLKKMKYAKHICEFEKDYTFTTHAGRRLSDLFQFKKRN